MSSTSHAGPAHPSSMPHGYPSFAQMQKFLTPERINYIKSDPERMKFVQNMATQLQRDPVFMKSVEEMLGQHGSELKANAPLPHELASFGWEGGVALPSPKQAAAAVGAAVAAMVVPVPVPV